ncbi:MAG: hypothetical protein AB8G22_01490 [Saprospiraceae bacterium]
MSATTEININLVVQPQQIWALLQQLPDVLKVEVLNQLQKDLEERKVIAKRTDRAQRLTDTTTLRPPNTSYTPLIKQDNLPEIGTDAEEEQTDVILA